jgi:hypothetical protein
VGQPSSCNGYKGIINRIIAKVKDGNWGTNGNRQRHYRRKTIVRNALEYQAFGLSAAVSACAICKARPAFYNRVYYPKSYFKRLRDAELQSVCTNLSTNCKAELAQLSLYGISAKVLAAFDIRINVFASKIKNPKEGIKKRKTATDSIAVHRAEITTLLNKQMDHLMVYFKVSICFSEFENSFCF